MLLSFDSELEKLLQILLFHLKPVEKAYLVGGVVRDIILRQPIHDLDIALDGDVHTFGRKVADTTGAAFFVLNEKFNTARIIFKYSEEIRMNLDIVKLRGKSIEEDLKMRDFTINAMAINLREQYRVIDPFNAVDDLRNHKLIACSEESFKDDPIRVLRALRQSIELGCTIEKKTILHLKEAVPLLDSISSERIRDEFFRLLNGKNVPQAIQVMDHIHAIEIIMPEVIELKESCRGFQNDESSWTFTFKVIKQLSFLDEILLHEKGSPVANNLLGGQIILTLGKFRLNLVEYFRQKLTEERSLRPLFYYLALFSQFVDQNNPFNPGQTRSEKAMHKFTRHSRTLALSNREIKYAIPILQNLDVIYTMRKEEKPLKGSTVYDFFHKTGESGILLCLLSLAESLAFATQMGDTYQFERQLAIVQDLFTGYFEKNGEWVNPPRWLNGNEVGYLLRAEDKTQTGYWLEKLKAASADKKINSKQDAIDFIGANYLTSTE